MYINKVEETTTTLIDNNSTICVQLIGSDGCTRDKVYFLLHHDCGEINCLFCTLRIG